MNKSKFALLFGCTYLAFVLSPCLHCTAKAKRPVPSNDASDIDSVTASIKFYDRIYRASGGRIGDKFISFEDAQEILQQMPNGNNESVSFSNAKVIYRANGQRRAVKMAPQETVEPIPLYYKMHSRFLAPTMLD
jgi:hypothetical protein